MTEESAVTLETIHQLFKNILSSLESLSNGSEFFLIGLYIHVD